MSSPSPQTGPSAAPSVSLKHILLSEILSVTSVMRKNSRWAMSTHPFGNTGESALASSLGLRRTRPYISPYVSDRGSNEQELMRGFQDLRRLVKDVEGTSYHTFSYLQSRSAEPLTRYPVVTSHYASGSLLCHHPLTIINRPNHVCRTLRPPQLLPMQPYISRCYLARSMLE